MAKRNADKYDIKHVISQQELKAGNIYICGRIPGGMLGNLMYLSSKPNCGKEQFNLYILQASHEGVKFDDCYLEMSSYPTKETIFKAEEQRAHGDAIGARSLIEGRTKKMIVQISKPVCG